MESGIYYVLVPPATFHSPIAAGQRFYFCLLPSPPPVLWDYFHEYGRRKNDVQLDIMVNVLQWGPLVLPKDKYGTRQFHALVLGPIPQHTAEYAAMSNIVKESETALGIQKEQVIFHTNIHPY